MGGAVPSDKRGTVVFDRSVYDLDTVKKSAYRFIGRFSTDIQQSDVEIICEIVLADTAQDSVEDCIAEFRSEVLDQDLRRTIAAETAPFRNAILALAFAQSGIKSDE